MVWFIIFLVGVALIGVIFYNGLISKKNQVDNAFASVDVLLKKRTDLIPNLVGTVQNYMQYEKSTLVELTRLRSRAMSSQVSPDERVALENQISRSLGGILVAVENYPELKANQNFMNLQGALNEIEEQISAARRFYNSAVTDYNNAVEMFPTNLIASQMNLRTKKVFEINEQERQNVNIKNLFNQP
jgi:LemA protein